MDFNMRVSMAYEATRRLKMFAPHDPNMSPKRFLPLHPAHPVRLQRRRRKAGFLADRVKAFRPSSQGQSLSDMWAPLAGDSCGGSAVFEAAFPSPCTWRG